MYTCIKGVIMQAFIFSGIAVIVTILAYDMFTSSTRRWGENEHYRR